MDNFLGWARFRDLPDDILNVLPDHVQHAFRAARVSGFEIELIMANTTIPSHHKRADRRLVVVADEGASGQEPSGPIAFDLAALTADVRGSKRVYVIGEGASGDVFLAAYAAASADLREGSDVAMIVETTAQFESAWIKMLTALRSREAATDTRPART